MSRQTPIDMTRSTDHMRAEREENERQAAVALQAELAEQAIRNEAACRFEAQVKAVPSELFAADPEIKALRADYEVKQRQRPVLSSASPDLVHQAMESLKERVKAGTLEAMIAAIEDVMTGDPTMRRLTVVQRQVDDDECKLELITKVSERLSRFGFRETARDREQIAGQALEDALMKRKRLYVREHPEVLGAPVAAPVAAPANDVAEV